MKYDLTINFICQRGLYVKVSTSDHTGNLRYVIHFTHNVWSANLLAF